MEKENRFDFAGLKLNLQLSLCQESLNLSEKSFCLEKQKTDDSANPSSEKSGDRERAIKFCSRKVSIFSSNKREASQERAGQQRENSYDQLARTFGFKYSINTCYVSESEMNESDMEDSSFSKHKLKTLNIIEDDISDLDGSIGQGHFQESFSEEKMQHKVKIFGSD